MSDLEDDDGPTGSEKGTESVRPIRALLRGLEALQKLNGRHGATVTDIARAIKLPRTTAYRVLETLCVAGVAIRHPADDRYRLTLKVRALADGFEDEPWIPEIARPILAKSAKDNSWPLAVATLHGASMLIREAAEREGPRQEGRAPALRASLLESSAGRLLLALSGDDQRSTLLDVLTRSERPEDRLARDKDQLNRILAEIRNNGWALYDDTASPELSLALPILIRNRMLGALLMRFTRGALNSEQAVEKYVPMLRRAAEEIGKAFEASPTPPAAG